ncbi:sulfatase-like hydrolase/transferase [Planctomycetota bacterium]
MKTIFILLLSVLSLLPNLCGAGQKPNIVLVMADDQGWGQVGYNGHPLLKTPNLDTMAESGIRFDRFYAAGPVCSPTRASVLTGRTHNRTGVPTHGKRLCLQEKILPQALKKAGYTTALFGKWHLNGVRGNGIPILGDDENHPGRYGFDEWLGVTNYFDMDPLMSRNGEFEAFKGDSSEVVVAEALKFMKKQKGSPFFAVIWYGSPHSPFHAQAEDRKGFPAGKYGDQLGEIVAIDRSMGTLRQGLRKLGIEKETLVWYTSDNGGLTEDPDACGHLRGHKGSVFEGGIRVPGIIEWPGRIKPNITDFPTSTMDIMPTIVDLLDLPEDSMLSVRDGESVLALFDAGIAKRTHPIPFTFLKQAALIDGNYKLVSMNKAKENTWQLFDLSSDPGETKDVSGMSPERFEQMKAEAKALLNSIEASAAGKDYPEGKVIQPQRSAFWRDMEEYQPHFETFAQLKPGFKVPDKEKKVNKKKPEKQ